jgi:actin-like ATPase involved in cell morphogenesis
MEAHRSKKVEVGGREFVVRPLRGKVARDVLPAIKRETQLDELVATVKVVLERTAPDVTEEWLLENGDLGEYRDVMEALKEVSGGKAEQGEAKAP